MFQKNVKNVSKMPIKKPAFCAGLKILLTWSIYLI